MLTAGHSYLYILHFTNKDGYSNIWLSVSIVRCIWGCWLVQDKTQITRIIPLCEELCRKEKGLWQADFHHAQYCWIHLYTDINRWCVTKSIWRDFATCLENIYYFSDNFTIGLTSPVVHKTRERRFTEPLATASTSCRKQICQDCCTAQQITAENLQKNILSLKQNLAWHKATVT